MQDRRNSSAITWLNLLNSVVYLLVIIFLWKFRMCLFKVKHAIGHTRGMVDLIAMKQKENALVGYWVNYVAWNFDLLFNLDLGVFKIKLRIVVSQEFLVRLI